MSLLKVEENQSRKLRIQSVKKNKKTEYYKIYRIYEDI